MAKSSTRRHANLQPGEIHSHHWGITPSAFIYCCCELRLADLMGNIYKAVLHALDLLPSSVFTHISCSPALMDLQRLRGPYTVSLDLRLTYWSEWLLGPHQYFGNLDLLYDILNQPSLRQLQISGLHRWFESNYDSGRLKERNLRGFSEVVFLILPNTVPAGIELKEILTWLKALRTFHLVT
jgi:hypothetical protein